MEGFKNVEYLKKLAENYNNDDIIIDGDAFDILWEIFSGNPRNSLNALYLALKRSKDKNLTKVDVKIMSFACFTLLKKMNPNMKYS